MESVGVANESKTEQTTRLLAERLQQASVILADLEARLKPYIRDVPVEAPNIKNRIEDQPASPLVTTIRSSISDVDLIIARLANILTRLD